MYCLIENKLFVKYQLIGAWQPQCHLTLLIIIQQKSQWCCYIVAKQECHATDWQPSNQYCVKLLSGYIFTGIRVNLDTPLGKSYACRSYMVIFAFDYNIKIFMYKCAFYSGYHLKTVTVLVEVCLLLITI